jgi:hypothetical protein
VPNEPLQEKASLKPEIPAHESIGAQGSPSASVNGIRDEPQTHTPLFRARDREALAQDLIRRARLIAVALRATWTKSKLPPKKQR